MKNFLFLIVILLLGCVDIASAQNSKNFVQGRFLGHPNDETCVECDPINDGITHIRFDPTSIKLSGDGGKNFVSFTTQIRAAGGEDDARYISAAAFRLQYDNAVFGDRLGTPTLPNADGSGNPAPQCTYERSSFFAQQIFYSLVFNDTESDLLNINERHALQTVLIKVAAPQVHFLRLGEEWTDLVTLTCEIPAGKTDNEARFGISGSQPKGIFYRRYTDDDPVNAVPTTAFLLADNDLRGFRLDGKTWAEDYVRYGSGKGVRVKFSKGIATQLTSTHFDLTDESDSNPLNDATVADVIHIPGSRHAEIVFNRTVGSGTLRLLSASTSVVMDVDGEALADNSFVASLYYDADAPRVSGIRKLSEVDMSTSTWIISFTKPINPATVSAEHLCITDREGVCPELKMPQVAPFVASAVALNSTQITVVVVGGNKEGGMRSIEFRRNAVLGTDYKIVEDYQAELRDIIELEDKTGPVIEVSGGTAEAIEKSDTNIRYRVTFVVHSSESVIGLFESDSYRILRVVGLSEVEEEGQSVVVGESPQYVPIATDASNIRAIAITLTDPDGSEITGRTALVSADIELTREEAEETYGFTLARVDNALDDESGNAPMTGPEGVLDEDPQAVSEIDRTPPTIEVIAQNGGVARIDRRGDTDIVYSMSFMVFATPREPVVSLSHGTTYELLRVLHNNSTATTTFTPSRIDFQTSSSTAIVHYEDVQLSVAQSEQTQGFTLGRRGGSVLIDGSGNQPVNVNGIEIAPRTRIDPRAGAIARVILRIRIRTKVFLETALD